jgi:hypothetical protein
MRRTGVGNIGLPDKNILEKIAMTAAKEFNWDTSRVEQELKNINDSLRLPLE